MKNLTNVLVFVVLLFLSASSMADEDEDKSAAISGTVFMPQVKKERRTFRGRIYRNRLATAKPSKNLPFVESRDEIVERSTSLGVLV